jgi:hypothetical protein
MTVIKPAIKGNDFGPDCPLFLQKSLFIFYPLKRRTEKRGKKGKKDLSLQLFIIINFFSGRKEAAKEDDFLRSELSWFFFQSCLKRILCFSPNIGFNLFKQGGDKVKNAGEGLLFSQNRHLIVIPG